MVDLFYGFSAMFFRLTNCLAKQKGVIILMYHRVNDSLPPGELVTSVKTFRAQMRYLKRYCDVLDVQQLRDIFSHPVQMRGRCRPQVVITIDDGYRDTYLNAFPILKEFDLPAIIFLATGFIGTDKKLARYVNMPSPDMMNWKEALEMSRHKIALGAHTISHPHLPQLSIAEQEAEIEGSIRHLEQYVPSSIARSVFCYPYGEYNQDTLTIMRKSGIHSALTVKTGINTAGEDPLQLKRVCAYGTQNIVGFIRSVNVSFFSGIRWRMNVIRDTLKM